MPPIRGTEIISAGKCWSAVWKADKLDGWMSVLLIVWSSSRFCNCQHVASRDGGKKPNFCSCISSLHLDSGPPHSCFQPPTNFLFAMWTLTSCDISPVFDGITVRRQKTGLLSVSTQSIQPVKTILIDQLKVTNKCVSEVNMSLNY